MAFDSSSTLQQTDEVAAVASAGAGAAAGGGSDWDDLTGELSGPVPFDATDDDGNPTSRSLQFLNVTPQVDVTSDPASGIALEIKDQTNGTRLGTLTTDGRWETRADQEAFADGSFNSGQGTNSLLSVENSQGDVLTTDAASLQFTGSGVSVTEPNPDEIVVDVSGGSNVGSLSDLSDVSSATQGDGNVLASDGTSYSEETVQGLFDAHVSLSASDVSGVSADSVTDAHHAKYTDSDAVSAIGASTPFANADLSNDTVTVAGNSVSLGNSTAINHGDLSSIGSSDHHTKTTSAADLTDVSADSVRDAHHPEYTDEKAQDAVNALLSGGNGISLSYDDFNDTLTISSTVSNTDTQTDLENAAGVVVADADGISFEAGANVSVAVADDGDTTGTVTISATDTNTQLTDSEVRNAINTDPDHGSTASHNYYTDADARGAINNDSNHGSTASHNYYTDENAQDAVDSLLVGGAGIDLSYDDFNNELTITSTVSNTDTQTDLENSGGVVVSDADGMSFEAGANSSVTVSSDNDGTGTVTISATDTDTQLTDSEVKTAIENATSDVAISISGDADTLDGVQLSNIGFADIAATRYRDEEAQDAINNLLTGGSGISLSYDDINNDLTITSTVTNTDTQTDLETPAGVVVSDANGIAFDAGANTTVSVSSDNDGTGTVLISSTDTDTQLSDNEVQTAINNDSDHGSTASHNYTTSASGLTDVSPDSDADAHHAVFEPTDYNPVSDVEAHGDALAIDITGDADTLDGHDESYFAALSENESVTGKWTISRNLNGGDVLLKFDAHREYDIRRPADGEAGNTAGLMFNSKVAGNEWKFGHDGEAVASFGGNELTRFFGKDVVLDGVQLGVQTTPSYAVDVNGDVRATGEVEAFLGSDRRLKTALDPLDSALDKVEKLTGYGFDWKEGKSVQPHKRGQGDVGLIAQEVKGVLPEAVKTFSDGHSEGYKSVSYDKLVPLLVEAIKDLRNQVNKLQ